jgi:D-alanine-D-alanine ligase
MNIEIITTPNENLKETGFGDIDTCNTLLASVQKLGHSVKLSVCLLRSDLEEVVKRKPDLVLLAVKYIVIEDEENVWLSEFFANNNINFSGSSRETLNYDSDKILAKTHLKEQGINTANYFTAVPGQFKNTNAIPIRYPLFLKPQDAANGNGIDEFSYVTNFSEFESKVLSLHNIYNQPILVEEYLDGQEFTVALIKTKNDGLLVSALEIIPAKTTKSVRMLGEKTKKENTVELKKTENSVLISKVKSIAVDAFIELGIRDFARIDIKTTNYGHCFFMEANLLPDLNNISSYFPKAYEIEHDLSYDEVIQLIVDEGISRA